MRGCSQAAKVTVLLYRVLNNCLVLLTQLAYSYMMTQQVALLSHLLFDDFLEVVTFFATLIASFAKCMSCKVSQHWLGPHLPVHTSYCYCIGLMSQRPQSRGGCHTKHTTIQGCYSLQWLIVGESVSTVVEAS